jgi:hypothetical protein
MTVVPLSVQFNHDLSDARSDALNLRRSGTRAVLLPEWRRGFSFEPAHAPAAYAIGPTMGSRITIRARFATDEPELRRVEVRTVNAASVVLGRVSPTAITFGPNGESPFHELPLAAVRIWTRGVGVDDIAWRWQIRRNTGDPWQDIGVTEHRIFTVLDRPTPPWTQLPMASTNTQLPWTDLLEYTCRWAAGAHTADEAASLITTAINGLGDSVVQYDCPGQGGTHYTWFYGTPWVVFDCTAFLELLRGDPLASRYVNCVDCATMVASLSNVLGCDLSTSGMFSNSGAPFALNPIQAIGSNVWQTACGWGSFKYHEVAWTGACSVNDEVFDACLHVDGDPDPTRGPHTPLLATNARFGQPGQGLYRDRLAAATPDGRANCTPQPAVTRRRRPIV